MAMKIVPPFTEETALLKVQNAENLWNLRDPEKVAAAYTEDSIWRNRYEFLNGREEIKAFLRRKWNRELDYRLKKYLWGFRENRIAISTTNGTTTAANGSAPAESNSGSSTRKA